MKRLILLLIPVWILAACVPEEAAQWSSDRIPAPLETYTLNGLEVTETIAFAEDQPMLEFQFAVTEEVHIGEFVARIDYYQEEQTDLSADRRAELETEASQMTAADAVDNLRVPFDRTYSPDPGAERTVIGEYSLPLGANADNYIIALYMRVTTTDPAGDLEDGQVFWINNGVVYNAVP